VITYVLNAVSGHYADVLISYIHAKKNTRVITITILHSTNNRHCKQKPTAEQHSSTLFKTLITTVKTNVDKFILSAVFFAYRNEVVVPISLFLYTWSVTLQ